MALTEQFVLPDGVVLQPVSDLPEHLRRETGAEEGDFTLSRPSSRTTSKVIDAEAAALLREFEKASTIAQAVARFSQGQSGNPEQLLEEALPMLVSLIDAGLLVSAESEKRSKIEPSLTGGRNVEGWTILRCVQSLDDTEIYQVRGPAGELGAMKIARPGLGPLGGTIAHEASILSDLDPTVTPRLLSAGEWEARPYLVTEWLSGSDAQTVCAELRQRGDTKSTQELLLVTGAILAAYVRLHDQGVTHGDVHPRNVLIDRRHGVKIVDLGWARKVTPDASTASPRAGVGFFYEPELAQAALDNVAPPPSTFAAEQYSVAALLYLSLTGSHYIDFSLERKEMLDQIVSEPLVPFEQRGVAPWPDVERLLAVALNKGPADRFPTMADFARAWRTAELPQRAHDESRIADSKLPDVVANLVADASLAGTLLRGDPMPAPSTSFNYGSAGLAYALLRIASASGDAERLALADLWSARAVREIGSDGAFYNEELEITPKTSLHLPYTTVRPACTRPTR